MNVCPEWLCGIVRGNESWWKEKGGEWGRRRKRGGQGVKTRERVGVMKKEKAEDKDGEKRNKNT